ncbi:cohesin domain-containing protein [Microbacterium radiodurans]|uniref:Cohesin domain-containing protein n=1 Tax=Microbacterium radiodurans TaxID=661398 RepID=A0A5J5IMI0_9MICO|nr:cohesin domain-containing protein [Microbacterium radiodurans]KAA9083790.1 hypothetical protein F6B42_14705 [Microbacterium radiodurans]
MPARPSITLAPALAGVVALTAALAAAPAAVAAPPTATFAIDVAATATEGDRIDVVLTATDVVDLYAYDLEISVPDALLDYVDDSATGPDGGFTAARETASGMITVTHSRLGTSPGLASDSAAPLTLATLSFTAEGAGAAEIELPSVRLVGSAGETALATDAAAADLAIAALPVAEPEPEPEPEPSASAPVAGAPAAGSGGSTSGSAAASGSLSATGGDATPIVLGAALGAALLAAGTAIVLRRRAVTA